MTAHAPHAPTPPAMAYCFFCGSPGPAGSSCPTCLVALANSALESPPRAECPRCRGRLLAVGFDGGATIHACAGACRGLFVPPRAWCTLVGRPDLVQAIDALRDPRRGEPRLPQATSSSADALVALVKCPVCTTQMERGRFGATSGIVVDVCLKHGQWLDAGELGAVVRYAAHRAAIGMEAAQREAARVGAPQTSAALFNDAMAIERARLPSPRVKEPTSLATHLKRAGLVVGVLLLLVRLGFYFYAERTGAAGTPMEGTGAGAKRAAEGAGTAIGGSP